MNSFAPLTWKPGRSAFQSLLTALSQATDPVYVVGGAVRDHLMGRPQREADLDVVVESAASHIARQVADRLGWAFYPLDSVRDVARLVFTASSPPLVCDIAAMRGGTIESDLYARDFTVNAMALRWQGRSATELVDPTGGQLDLERRLLRRVTPASMAEDPVRLLRAVRFAMQLDFELEEETQLQLMRMGDTVKLVSPERVRDELWKIMASPTPERSLDLLHRYSLLRPVLPEIADMDGVAQSQPHVLDVYQHTLETIRFARQFRAWLKGEAPATGDGATWRQALDPWLYRLRTHFLQPLTSDHQRVDWLVWHALWHDAGKPSTRTKVVETGAGVRYQFIGHEDVGAALATARLEELRFSRQEIHLAQAVVQSHMRPHHLEASFGPNPISRRAIYRFFRDAGGKHFAAPPGVDTLLLALADYQAIFATPTPPHWDSYLRHAAQLLEYAFSAKGLDQTRRPLVDGYTVMQYFSLPPGRLVGKLLDHLQEAQAAGDIATPDEALVLAAAWMQEARE